LHLTLGSVVSGEACANTLFVVADSASGAVTALVTAIASHDIIVRWAFTEGAVRSARPNVTDTTLLLDSVPRGGVCLGSFGSKLLGGDTDTTAGAVVRAHGTFASITFVVVEALTKTGLAVAVTLVGALCAFVTAVAHTWHRCPSFAKRAGTQRAIVSSPGVIDVIASNV